MMFLSIWSDATKTALSMMEAGMENVRNTQDAMVRQTEIASQFENPWTVKWANGPMPFPVLTFRATDARATREAFHLMADVNLSAWENVAKAYGATPAWMKLPVKAPGEFWAKWFDQFQDGKFDAPFPKYPNAILEALLAKASPVAPANETSGTPAEDFTLESPMDDTAPALLDAPDGEADDLTAIKGIGAKLQKTLNDTGVYHFAQIASWTPENIAWLDEKLSFKGRIYREGWVDQARDILKKAA